MGELIQSLGIPTTPSGEVSIVQFVMDTPSEERALLQARLTGIQYQLALNYMASLVFARNLAVIIKLLYAQPHNLTAWLCVIPALLGMVHGMVSSFSFAVGSANCRTMVWFVTCALTVSTMSNSFIVLQKAYLALCRQWWILSIGTPLILLQLGFAYLTIWYSPITLEANSGCVVHYPDFIPWYWFGLIIPINAFFSGIFSYVTYKQYIIYKSDAWRLLARKGIEIMCLVILCNLICGTCIFLRIGGHSTIFFFVVDW
ncbi:hypothetical protein SYNPS1DRAFT_25190 [Syncephalis pseudoplumigaleata]|uniref:G-protein coupled receptors family 2 profile 2 domain-containing protein n=1 Tax=Syncephalis pseudoplumigaleata TaxID=1712513 RepID=A0A4P9YUJ9_9FUNG|nr:hypothetical protein SYNPS1DRAFT_25190 [Syncephalis pseudoplumigaleata]|eukprot:RKP22881.1 hypothetical protein SYNPS1DRAFT_25190 [Syncephalis pseudoplumigaleata]